MIFLTALFVSLNVFANDAIPEAVKKFDAVEELKDYYDVLNDFERIISQGDCDWIPYYYSSLCLINIAGQSEPEKVDEYCDKADEYLKEADKLNPNNSEVYCLKALSASTRIRVNFEERGFRYVTLSNSLLEKAKSFNDSNPRIFYLKGMNTINLPADISFDDFKSLYGKIHNYGVKGCTTYREGTSVAILETKREEKEKEIKEQQEEFLEAFKGHENGNIIHDVVKLPEEYPSMGYVIRAQKQKWYLHVAFKDRAKRKPFAIFVNTNNTSPTVITMSAIDEMKKLAIEVGLAEDKISEIEKKSVNQKNPVKIARMLGFLLRHNVQILDIIKALDRVEDAHPGTFVFRIKKFLGQFITEPVENLGIICSSCGSSDVILQEGCALCRACGSSKCS